MKPASKSFAHALFRLALVGAAIAFFYGLAYLSVLVAPAAVALLTLGITYGAFRCSGPSGPAGGV